MEEVVVNKNTELCMAIDLGIHNSFAAICIGQQVQVIPLDDGLKNLYPFISFNEGQRLLGIPAFGRLTRNPLNTVFDFKKLLGKSFTNPTLQQDAKCWEFRLQPDANNNIFIVLTQNGQQVRLSPQYLTSMIFSRIKFHAQSFLKGPISKVVLTVPCYYNSTQRQAIINSAAIAGLQVVRLVNQPIAGAFAHIVSRHLANCNILVFKMGTGSTEILVGNLQDGTFQIVAVVGCPGLGGDEFCKAVTELCLLQLKNNRGIDIRCESRAVKRLRWVSSIAIRTLSLSTKTFIQVDNLYKAEDFSMSITRQQFQNVTLPLIQQTKTLILEAISKSHFHPTAIREILLIGGSTRMPWVTQLLKSLFAESQISRQINPEQVSAMGAALYASHLCSPLANPLNSLLVMNITTNSFWLRLNGQPPSELIQQGMLLPLLKTQTIPIGAMQSTLLQIYQGDRAKVETITLISSVSVQPLPYPCQLEVTVKIDSNRIVSCQVRNKETFEVFQKESLVYGLTNQGVKNMREISELQGMPRLKRSTRLDDID